MPAFPEQMTAIAIRAPGDADMLVPERRPLPLPGGGEVLVRVAAAGVNRPDVMQRRGLYPPPAGATDIPGLEIAGEVVARGDGAGRWNIGDTVMALVVGGGYAEYCTAHEGQVGGFDRDVRTGAHGQAEVGLGQGRGVVDAVADHGDDLSPVL